MRCSISTRVSAGFDLRAHILITRGNIVCGVLQRCRVFNKFPSSLRTFRMKQEEGKIERLMVVYRRLIKTCVIYHMDKGMFVIFK